MIKARSTMSGLCVVFALLCTGCLGDAVRDYVLDQVESQQADNNDASIASRESGSAESDPGSQHAVERGDATPRAVTGFDPYDRSPPPAAESPPIAHRDTPPAVPRRYELDASNNRPSIGQSNGALDQTGDDPPPTNGTGISSSGKTQPEIRLRTAIALAQTLPTGTAIGFSVDYQFIGAPPDSRVRYVWVIKPPSGQPWESVVQLQSRGNLQTFVKQWGPVSGTYEMRIDEVTRYGRKPATRPVSATYQ